MLSLEDSIADEFPCQEGEDLFFGSKRTPNSQDEEKLDEAASKAYGFSHYYLAGQTSAHTDENIDAQMGDMGNRNRVRKPWHVVHAADMTCSPHCCQVLSGNTP